MGTKDASTLFLKTELWKKIIAGQSSRLKDGEP